MKKIIKIQNVFVYVVVNVVDVAVNKSVVVVVENEDVFLWFVTII